MPTRRRNELGFFISIATFLNRCRFPFGPSESDWRRKRPRSVTSVSRLWWTARGKLVLAGPRAGCAAAPGGRDPLEDRDALRGFFFRGGRAPSGEVDSAASRHRMPALPSCDAPPVYSHGVRSLRRQVLAATGAFRRLATACLPASAAGSVPASGRQLRARRDRSVSCLRPRRS